MQKCEEPKETEVGGKTGLVDVLHLHLEIL